MQALNPIVIILCKYKLLEISSSSFIVPSLYELCCAVLAAVNGATVDGGGSGEPVNNSSRVARATKTGGYRDCRGLRDVCAEIDECCSTGFIDCVVSQGSDPETMRCCARNGGDCEFHEDCCTGTCVRLSPADGAYKYCSSGSPSGGFFG